MIEAVGLIIGIVGVVFAFETPRRRFVRLFKPSLHPSEILQPVLTTTRVLTAPTHGAAQSGRSPFFISRPYTTLSAAQDESHRSGKPIFLVIYDGDQPSKSQLHYSLGCFMEYFTTKRLVDDYFVPALLEVTASGALNLVPEDDPLENALWVVLSPNGEIIRREGVYANPDEGLKRVRSVIAGVVGA